MNTKILALALAAGATLMVATGAQAHDGRWDRGYHHGHYRHYGPKPYHHDAALPAVSPGYQHG